MVNCALLTILDDYGALEPSISGKIMELHHKNHHNTYVTSYNAASEKLAAAEASSDIAAQIALKPLINFHGGGHLNHSLFWENLAPKSSGGGDPPSGKLSKAIDETYGSLDSMIGKFNTALAGIQGSGWAWLVKDNETGQIGIKTYAVRWTPPIPNHLRANMICRTKTPSSDNTLLSSALMHGSTHTSKRPFVSL